jgi:hypothetical protein
LVNQSVYLDDALSVDLMIICWLSTCILFPNISTAGVPWPCASITRRSSWMLTDTWSGYIIDINKYFNEASRFQILPAHCTLTEDSYHQSS